MLPARLGADEIAGGKLLKTRRAGKALFGMRGGLYRVATRDSRPANSRTARVTPSATSCW